MQKTFFLSLVATLATGAVFLINPPHASALSCLPLPENILDRGEVIFMGTVTDVAPNPEADGDNFGLRAGGTATFNVSRYWKGGTSTPVTVHNIYAWGVEGSFFRVGAKYIVFAHEEITSSSTILSASIDCGGTALATNALAQELDKATVGRAPTTPLPVQAFTRNLTIGSSGSDVALLQHFLEDKGFLTMPSGVAKGYFGPITRAALSKYQATHQIMPAVGYFGPITRERVRTEMMDREGVI